jgi:hypothetical protein
LAAVFLAAGRIAVFGFAGRRDAVAAGADAALTAVFDRRLDIGALPDTAAIFVAFAALRGVPDAPRTATPLPLAISLSASPVVAAMLLAAPSN